MQIVSSTFIAFAVLAFILARGPYRGLLFFFAVTPMGAMAAINLPALGGTSITVIDVTVAGLFGLVLLGRDAPTSSLLRPFLPGTPGGYLLLFLVYAAVASAFLPRIFAGDSLVFGIGRGANDDGIALTPLGPGNGNLSQMYRLILGLMIFSVTAALIRRRPDPAHVLKLMVVATTVNVALGLFDILSYAAGLEALMDTFRTANYSMAIGHHMAGMKRMVGGFPEASAFGYYSIGVMGFWISYWFSTRSGGRLVPLMLLISIFVVLRSTSSSTYVATLAFCGIFAFFNMTGSLGQLITRRGATLLVTFLGLVPLVIYGLYLSYEMLPGFQSFVDRSLLDKMATDSGQERMSWNTQAIQNMIDTNYLGTGLGSMRASSWLFACLASTGIIGTLLLLAFLAKFFLMRTRGSDPDRDERAHLARAFKYGCVAQLLSAMLSQPTPNLDSFFFAMAGLAFGLSSVGRQTVATSEATGTPPFMLQRGMRHAMVAPAGAQRDVSGQ